METTIRKDTAVNSVEQLLHEQMQLNRALQQQLIEQTTFIKQLQQQIESLQRLLYGKKSERRSKSKDEDNQDEDKPAADEKKSKSTNTQSNRNGRGTLPAHIEREKVLHEICHYYNEPYCRLWDDVISKEVPEEGVSAISHVVTREVETQTCDLAEMLTDVYREMERLRSRLRHQELIPSLFQKGH